MEKITIADLAAFVAAKERELAYGSETSLLGAFVAKYGYVDDALHDDTIICPAELSAWQEAYEEENGEI